MGSDTVPILNEIFNGNMNFMYNTLDALIKSWGKINV